MEAPPSAAKLYVDTFMHSPDLTYGFVKLLVRPPSQSANLPVAHKGILYRQIPCWSDPSYWLRADASPLVTSTMNRLTCEGEVYSIPPSTLS